jgi:hypothetical protein
VFTNTITTSFVEPVIKKLLRPVYGARRSRENKSTQWLGTVCYKYKMEIQNTRFPELRTEFLEVVIMPQSVNRRQCGWFVDFVDK